MNEARTRVTMNLPCGNANEERALQQVIEYLLAQRRKCIGVDGFTHSSIHPPVFHGIWWDESDSGQVIRDGIVIFTVDFCIGPENSKFTIAGEIEKLKSAIRERYERNGSPQQEIWVVSQHILREA